MENILLYLIALIIPIIASIRVHSVTKKYKKHRNNRGLTGFDVAREMLDRNGLSNIYVVEQPGDLTDHYDSSRKTIRLSTDVFHGDSITALAVAAHECGHAIQDKEDYSWMRIRSAFFPILNVGTKIAYVVLLISIFLSSWGMLYASIGMVGLSLIFEIITLPVEFDASKRAKAYLSDNGLIDTVEEEDVKKVLDAAAWTYVAAVISSLLEMIRLLLILNDRRD